MSKDTDHWSSPNGCHPDCPACEQERDDCKECKGNGYLLLGNTLSRCDSCQRYGGDLAAAEAFFKDQRNKLWYLETITVRRKEKDAAH